MRRSILLFALLVACGGGSDPAGPVAVSTIVISDSPGFSMTIGETRPLSASARDAGGNVLGGRTITWSSSAQAVATVSTSGVVTAVGAGTAQIRATSEGKSGEVAVTVNPPVAVASVSISNSPGFSLITGSTLQLSASARDAQGNALAGRTIAWSSTANEVATVSSTGLVTAVSPGTAQIRATSEGRVAEVSASVSAHPWTLTGSLATGRTLHSATLLATGRVLVVGGQSLAAPFQTFASAELYDPTAGTWSPTGSLATARENHFAVRLQDGKILVGGGYSIEQQAQLRSVELYDPATGLWTPTGSMTVARDLPSAVLLNDGRVLVAGGQGAAPSQALGSAEIYDPATGSWTATGSMTSPRMAHSAVLLPNGRGLVAGGASGTLASPQLLNTAEQYDVAAGTWTAAGSFGTARGFHRSVLQANGAPLIVGGSNFVSAPFSSTDRFDPAAGTWAAVGALATARISHTATLLPNGRILVAGGGGTAPAPLSSVELFDATTGVFTAGISMRVGRSNHAAVLLPNGKVLVVGGQGTGASTSAEIFDPSA